MRVLGIDFGTTNSTLALGTAAGVEAITFEASGRSHETCPSLLYVEPSARAGRPVASTGHQAIERYLHADRGRLMQSLKSYLPTKSFTETRVYGKTYLLEDLVGLIVADLRRHVPAFDPAAFRVIAGRQVRFVGARTPADDAYAEGRLRDSFARGGFPEVELELEPVAAAYAYESRLDHDELVLVADFGGGTSDFCLMDVGPGTAGVPSRERIRGTDGVGIAGDTFDRRIVRQVVEPELGRDTEYRSSLGKELPVPQWLYSNFEHWHLLSFLNTPETRRVIEELVRTATDPEKLVALLDLIEHEAGYHLYRAVERVKAELSSADSAVFAFREARVHLTRRITRVEFEQWIAGDVAALHACVDRLLETAGVAPDRVQRVFLTGGTSFVPAVRNLFADRFGQGKLSPGQEFTSVARGLAYRGLR